MIKLSYFLRIGIAFIIVSLLILFGLQGFAKAEGSPPYKELDQATLQVLMKRGPFLCIDEAVPGRVKPSTVGMLIEANPEQVWNIITDYESYPELIPSVKEAKVLERNANTAIVYFKVVVLEIGLIKIATNYTLKMTFCKPDRIIISWVKGKVKDVNGFWDLIPIEEGKKTAAFYTISGDYRKAAIGADFLFSRQPELETLVSLSSSIVLLKATKKKAESQ
ncbi:MAG: SRPBCC family protein [Deltaproteobacteria bacterium]|nr:SRPBCC family protein [Deltaproteobacteria bacterium]